MNSPRFTGVARTEFVRPLQDAKPSALMADMA